MDHAGMRGTLIERDERSCEGDYVGLRYDTYKLDCRISDVCRV